MIQELGADYAYDNRFVACEPSAGDYVLHFLEGKCLTHVRRRDASDADAFTGGEEIELPRLADYARAPEHTTYLFAIGGKPYFLALDDKADVPAGFSYESVSWLRHTTPAHLLFAAVTAYQLDGWYRENRLCARCGHPMELAPASREIVCPECARIVYPKIQPGVICAVTSEDGEKIVLTRYAGRTTALWALVAGFTEIGESVEDTVAREVMEEVGLRVKNLRFYKSQPWSFSSTLLLGFWCEVDGDPTITVDHSELKEARWFSRDEMPLERTGDHASLTGEMIERFRLMGADAWR